MEFYKKIGELMMNETRYSDNFDESWDIYNEKLQKTGVKKRRDALAKGEFHLVVGVFIFDNNNNVLLQKRTLSKLSNPGKWQESAGGSVLKDENVYQAARREVGEELGIELQINKDSLFFREVRRNWITFWFAATTDFEIANLDIQESEVDEVETFEIIEAIELLKNKGIDNTWKILKLIAGKFE
ncbi:MAG: NUDIX domain-containing protein [Liquorilactobacillus mali]